MLSYRSEHSGTEPTNQNTNKIIELLNDYLLGCVVVNLANTIQFICSTYFANVVVGPSGRTPNDALGMEQAQAFLAMHLRNCAHRQHAIDGARFASVHSTTHIHAHAETQTNTDTTDTEPDAGDGGE